MRPIVVRGDIARSTLAIGIPASGGETKSFSSNRGYWTIGFFFLLAWPSWRRSSYSSSLCSTSDVAFSAACHHVLVVGCVPCLVLLEPTLSERHLLNEQRNLLSHSRYSCIREKLLMFLERNGQPVGYWLCFTFVAFFYCCCLSMGAVQAHVLRDWCSEKQKWTEGGSSDPWATLVIRLGKRRFSFLRTCFWVFQ